MKISAAEDIAGGIEPLAKMLKVTTRAIYKWKVAGDDLPDERAYQLVGMEVLKLCKPVKGKSFRKELSQ